MSTSLFSRLGAERRVNLLHAIGPLSPSPRHAAAGADADASVPAPTAPAIRTGPAHARRRRTPARAGLDPARLRTALTGFGAILAVTVTAAVAAHLLHSVPASTGAASPTHSAATSAAAPTASRGAAAATTAAGAGAVESATNDIVAVTMDMRSGFAAISGIPTTAAVVAVVDPFANALRLYSTYLGATRVPSRAVAAARAVETQVHQSIAFLEGLDGLAPEHLGSFILGVFSHATSLQADVGRLERDLRAPPAA